MSSEDRGAPYPPAAAPVYTVNAAGEQQYRMNYGFHLSRPQEPPPKYEDVVSGEYLQWNLLNRGATSTTPSLPTQLESEAPSQEEEKEKSHKAAGALLFLLLLIVIFIWGVSTM